jgi:hypothetical protein
MEAIGNIFKTRNVSKYNNKSFAKIGIRTNFQNTVYNKTTSDVVKCPTK